MIIKGLAWIPNSSTPIKIHATRVFVAPAKTATKPKPANKPTGSGINQTSALPRHAPIKNNGVTSPPLKPKPMVNVVSNSFIKKSLDSKGLINASLMVGIPNPINF